MCSYAAGMVFRTDGAQGVGIVNAMRGATVALVSHAFFCSPAKPLQCLTTSSAVSAATVTSGGIVWVQGSGPDKVHNTCTFLFVNHSARTTVGVAGCAVHVCIAGPHDIIMC